MAILESTLFASAFMTPGVVALGLALSPRGRASRAAKVTPRLVGSIALSIIIWVLWLLLFGSSYAPDLASFLLDENEARNRGIGLVLALEWPFVRGLLLLTLITLLTGIVAAILHNLALGGLAISDYSILKPERALGHNLANIVYSLARLCRIDHFVLPCGAAYASVIQRALHYQQAGKPPLLYADVLQGTFWNEPLKKPGILYTGEFSHLVCDNNGVVTSIVLRNAQRWAASSSVSIPRPTGFELASIERKPLSEGGGLTDSAKAFAAAQQSRAKTPPGGFRPIADNYGLVINGADIMNISFRPYTPAPDKAVDPKQILNLLRQFTLNLEKETNKGQ